MKKIILTTACTFLMGLSISSMASANDTYSKSEKEIQPISKQLTLKKIYSLCTGAKEMKKESLTCLKKYSNKGNYMATFSHGWILYNLYEDSKDENMKKQALKDSKLSFASLIKLYGKDKVKKIHNNDISYLLSSTNAIFQLQARSKKDNELIESEILDISKTLKIKK